MSLFSNISDQKLEFLIEEKKQLVTVLMGEIEKVVVGHEYLIKRLLMGLFTNGHILLEGVPGLAKTLTISTLASALTLDFKRIQFTPDLLPADLIGTLIYNQRESRFEVKRGPIFSNLVLADEINRSPAKVQSALLEAMQEKQVTIGDHTFKLDNPFLVLATQNPIDQEGTYPLPEAQVDRFMMKILVSYPSKEEEKAIMRRMAKTGEKPSISAVFTVQDIMDMREIIDSIPISEKLEDYIIDIVFASRHPEDYGLEHLKPYIEFGASPRASLALNLGARANAFMEGRAYVLPEDIKAVAMDVLSHRVILTYEAEADELNSRKIIQSILDKVGI